MSGFAQTAHPSDAVATRRPVYWLRAFRALSRLARDEFSSEAAREFGAALEGDEGERAYRAFLREAGAQALRSERPDLAAALDDHGALASMPEGSLGRAYLALAEGDGIRVQTLVRGSRSLPAGLQYGPDPLRRWYRERRTALHDLHHVLTGYGRDAAGEVALIAFSHGLEPKRIWRVTLLFSLASLPKRHLGRLLPYLHRAWRRGRRARIPAAAPWEQLLALPLAEVQARLSIPPASAAHPGGIWRGERNGVDWAPVPARSAVA